MSTYKAWDGNDYPSPPPDGWYQASDSLWWPEGYGPGPAVASPAPAPMPEPEPAPAPAPPPSYDAPRAESPSFEAPRAESPSFEAPRAESPSFDRDPTTVMPTPQPTESGIAGHPMPAPGPADSWSAPPAGAPTGFGAPEQPSWSQPPGATPPGGAPPPGFDTPSSGSSSNKRLLIGAAALLALVVVAGLAFVLTRGGGGDDDDVVAFDATAVKGSAANPHTAGDLVRLSYDDPDTGAATEWTIEVVAAPVDSSAGGGDTADATVNLRVALAKGDAPETLSVLTFTAVSPDGRRTSTGSCAPLSTPLPEDRLVSVGETAEGSVCWQVPAADLGALTMRVEVDGIDGRVYMKLQ